MSVLENRLCEITREIIRLLADKGVTAHDAQFIARRLDCYASEHMSFVQFNPQLSNALTTELTNSVQTRQTASCETQTSAPVDRASSAKATKRLPVKRKVPAA